MGKAKAKARQTNRPPMPKPRKAQKHHSAPCLAATTHAIAVRIATLQWSTVRMNKTIQTTMQAMMKPTICTLSDSSSANSDVALSRKLI